MHPCFPPAIIYTNTDIVQQIQHVLTRQLYLTEIITAAEFDARVAADPNYPLNIHLNKLRVLVMRDLSDCTNRHLADIVLFLKAGLAYILHNKVGPTRFTTSIDKMYLQGLIAGDRIHFEHHHHRNRTISDELIDRADYHRQEPDDPPHDLDNPNDELILDITEKEEDGRYTVEEEHHCCTTREFEEDDDEEDDDDDGEEEEHEQYLKGPHPLQTAADVAEEAADPPEEEHHHHHHHHHEDEDVHQISDDMFGGLAEDIDEDDLTVSELEAQDASINQGTEGD